MWSDVEMSRTALYHYVSLIDCVLGERDSERHMALLRAFALSWEGDTPTVQEYRAFLCKLVSVRTEDAVLHATLSAMLAESDDQFAVFVEDHVFDDDDDDDDLDADDDRVEKRSIMWTAHCMIYSPRRGFTPGMYFGEQSCRWYLHSDEDNATSSSDLSPVITGTPMSVCVPVSRMFVGDSRVAYERLATGRTALYGDYAVETPSTNRPKLYEDIQVDLFGDGNDQSIFADTSSSALPFAVELEASKQEGVPRLRPSMEDITYTTTTQNLKNESYTSEDVADMVRESMAVDRAQAKFKSNVRGDLGVSAANMMNCTESVPSYRVFYDIHSSFTSSNRNQTKRAYDALARTRRLGECMHQWARDIATVQYWSEEVVALQSRDAKMMNESDEMYMRAHPESPNENNHMSWIEEVVRINYEVYFRRALIQDFDEIALAADVESDAAVRVRPLSDDHSSRRTMMPCAARRSLSAVGLCAEEVRAQYFEMLSDVHAYSRSDSSKQPSMTVSKLSSVRFVRPLIILFSASTVSKWIRQWCALEGVDRIDSDGSFKQRTMPILHRYSLAPRLTDTEVRSLLNSAVLTARAGSSMSWNGDYFSAAFPDQSYEWLYCPEEYDLGSIVSMVNERVNSCFALTNKRAQEMVISSLSDRARETEIRLGYSQTDLSSLGNSTIRMRNAMLLLLGAGVFSGRQTFAVGRRYYVDMLNALVNRTDEYNAGDAPSHLALPIEYDPLLGWMARALNTQFSSALRPEFYTYLELMEQNDPNTSSVYRALETLSTVGGTMPMTNAAYHLADSVLNQVGVCTILGSPIRHLVWSLDFVDSEDEVARNETQFHAMRIIADIASDTVLYGDRVVNAYNDNRSTHPIYSAVFRRNNMNCATYSARQCNWSAFMANNLSIGDSRHDLFQYGSERGLFLPNSVDVPMAPAGLIGYTGDPNNSKWIARYDMAMWHNHKPYITRRQAEVKNAHRHARVAREDVNLLTDFAADRARRGGAGAEDDTLRFVTPFIGNDEEAETKRSLWTFSIEALSSYFWAPYSLDSRAEDNPRVYTSTTVAARNKRTFYNETIGPIYRVSNTGHWSVDMLDGTRMAMRAEPRAFSHFQRNELGVRTTVYVDALTEIRMRPNVVATAAYSRSLKPYPLRCPGVDYAVADWVRVSAIDNVLSDLYTGYADHRGFKAFVATSYHSAGFGMSAMPKRVERSILAPTDRLPVEHRYSYEYLPSMPTDVEDQYSQVLMAVQTHQRIVYT
jgi:hypothetical protein